MELSGDDLEIGRQLYNRFPLLRVEKFEITSPRDIRYNCIAWAAGETTRIWWPFKAYWPPTSTQETTVQAFVAAYKTKGYKPCDSRELEKGFDKIALYVGDQYQVLHAARQLPDGKWTSKLGPQFDISHSLAGLEGKEYGHVAQVLKRRQKNVQSNPGEKGAQ
jgi:hypothetical protein